MAHPNDPPAGSADSDVSVFEAGPTAHWSSFRLDIAGLPGMSKLFLKDRLGLTGMEISLNSMAPGEDMPFVHRHRDNEEVYVFLSGDGELQADGRLIPIRAGTCIRCGPAVRRSWRNSGTGPLIFLVIQAKAGSYGPTRAVEDGELVPEKPLW